MHYAKLAIPCLWCSANGNMFSSRASCMLFLKTTNIIQVTLNNCPTFRSLPACHEIERRLMMKYISVRLHFY